MVRVLEKIYYSYDETVERRTEQACKLVQNGLCEGRREELLLFAGLSSDPGGSALT